MKQTAIQVSAYGKGVATAINTFLAEHPTMHVVAIYPIQVEKTGGRDTEAIVIFEEN